MSWFKKAAKQSASDKNDNVILIGPAKTFHDVILKQSKHVWYDYELGG